MAKSKRVKPAAMRTGSAETTAMLLRNGSGKHDPRPNRQRTRSAQKRAAIAVSW